MLSFGSRRRAAASAFLSVEGTSSWQSCAVFRYTAVRSCVGREKLVPFILRDAFATGLPGYPLFGAVAPRFCQHPLTSTAYRAREEASAARALGFCPAGPLCFGPFEQVGWCIRVLSWSTKNSSPRPSICLSPDSRRCCENRVFHTFTGYQP